MNKQQRQNAFGALMSFEEYMNEQQKAVLGYLLNEATPTGNADDLDITGEDVEATKKLKVSLQDSVKKAEEGYRTANKSKDYLDSVVSAANGTWDRVKNPGLIINDVIKGADWVGESVVSVAKGAYGIVMDPGGSIKIAFNNTAGKLIVEPISDIMDSVSALYKDPTWKNTGKLAANLVDPLGIVSLVGNTIYDMGKSYINTVLPIDELLKSKEAKQKEILDKVIVNSLSDVACAKLVTILKEVEKDDFKIPVLITGFEGGAELNMSSTKVFFKNYNSLELDETGFPKIGDFMDYMLVNTNKTNIGLASATLNMVKYLKGELPEKTWVGAIEGWIWAALILAVMYALTKAMGPFAGQAIKAIYNSSEWKSIEKATYNTFGTLAPGLRQEIYKLGNVAGEFLGSPTVVAIQAVGTWYKLGSQIQAKLDATSVEKNLEIATRYFLPFFEALPKVIGEYKQNVATIYAWGEQADDKVNQAYTEFEELYKGDSQRKKAWANYAVLLKMDVKGRVKSEFQKLVNKCKPEKNDIESINVNYLTNGTPEMMTDENALLGVWHKFKNVLEFLGNNVWEGYDEKIYNEGLDASIEIKELLNKRNPYYTLFSSLYFLALNNAFMQSPVIYYMFKGVKNLPKPKKEEFPEITFDLELPPFPAPEIDFDELVPEDPEEEDDFAFRLSLVDKFGNIIKGHLGSATFVSGSDTLDKQNFTDKLNQLVKKYPKVSKKMIIIGTADVTGNEPLNDSLSKRRAKSVANVIKKTVKSIKEIYTTGVGTKFANSYTKYRRDKKEDGFNTKALIQDVQKNDKSVKEEDIRKSLKKDRKIEGVLFFKDADFTKYQEDSAVGDVIKTKATNGLFVKTEDGSDIGSKYKKSISGLNENRYIPNFEDFLKINS